MNALDDTQLGLHCKAKNPRGSVELNTCSESASFRHDHSNGDMAIEKTHPNPHRPRNSVQHGLILKGNVFQLCCHVCCADRVVAGMCQLAVKTCHGMDQGLALQRKQGSW